MLSFTFILLFIIMISLVIFSANYLTHLIMCITTAREEKNKIIYLASFTEFFKEFIEYKLWVKDIENIHSIFSSDFSDYNKYYIHAGVVVVNNKAFCFSPLSYLQFILWKHNYLLSVKLKNRKRYEF